MFIYLQLLRLNSIFLTDVFNVANFVCNKSVRMSIKTHGYYSSVLQEEVLVEIRSFALSSKRLYKDFIPEKGV